MPPIHRRYILFKLNIHEENISDDQLNIDAADIVVEVRNNVQTLHGDFGLGSVMLNFHCATFNKDTRTGILVVKREIYHFVITTLPLISSIREHRVSFEILKLSGTIRGCHRSLQGYHGKMIAMYRKKLTSTSKPTKAVKKHNLRKKTVKLKKRKRKMLAPLETKDTALMRLDSGLKAVEQKLIGTSVETS